MFTCCCCWSCVCCCCTNCWANNCCLTAELCKTITDSVFSRRGRKKSKFLPVKLLVQLVLFGVAPVVVAEMLLVAAAAAADVLVDDLLLAESLVLFKSFLKMLLRCIMALALCAAEPKACFCAAVVEDCNCCCCCCCSRLVFISTAECRFVRGKKSEFSRRKPRIKFCGNLESDSCRL